jgi:hypothetical protein
MRRALVTGPAWIAVFIAAFFGCNPAASHRVSPDGDKREEYKRLHEERVKDEERREVERRRIRQVAYRALLADIAASCPKQPLFFLDEDAEDLRALSKYFRVLPLKDAAGDADKGYRDKKTGDEGVCVQVLGGDIRWPGPPLTIRPYVAWGDSTMTVYTLVLDKKDGGWIVTDMKAGPRFGFE